MIATQKVWAYPIKSKDEVREVFARSLTEVENRAGLKVKTFMSDNGGEYTSKEFIKYLSEKGI